VGYIAGYATAINHCIKAGEKILNISLKPEALNEIASRFPELWTYIKT